MVSSIVLLYNVCLATPCRTTDSLLLEPTVFKPIRPNIKPKYDHIFESVRHQILSQNQISKLMETYKMKVVLLHDLTPKQFSMPTLTQKKAH